VSGLPAFTRAAVAERLRRTAFAGVTRHAVRPRIGAEVELLSIDAATRRVASVADAVLPFLRTYGPLNGWTEMASAKGAPRFILPAGGVITLEPGGQVEYASRPHSTPRDLLDDLDAIVPPLIAAAADEGLALEAAGIDPHNALDHSPLQLTADRYTRMDAYFASIGTAGARMMRQTASVQVNVDPVGEVSATWRMLNAAAPFLTAIFANSSRYAGEHQGVASVRALTWRELDPLRTGILPCSGDPADEYAGFALWAPAMLRGDEDGGYLPFCEWVRRGRVDDDFFDTHLTTLFPEVRPKGYMEVRAIDALPPAEYAAPVLLLAGITRDHRARAAAVDVLGPPDPALLETAALHGVADARLRRTAADLFDIALEGCAHMGEEVCGAEWLASAAAYRQRLFATHSAAK
jgi:glutamate--cysteine ligase